MRRSSVDLPQPLGPTSETISPAASVSDSRSSTGTAEPSAAKKVLLTPRTTRVAPSAAGGETAVTTVSPPVAISIHGRAP